jgi:hypothetical protein
VTTTCNANACQTDTESPDTIKGGDNNDRENAERYVVRDGCGLSLNCNAIPIWLDQVLFWPTSSHLANTPKRSLHRPFPIRSTRRTQPASPSSHPSGGISHFLLDLMSTLLLLVVLILLWCTPIRMYPLRPSDRSPPVESVAKHSDAFMTDLERSQQSLAS